MIALEIKDNEIRGLLTTGNLWKTEIQKTHTEKIDKSIIEDLFTGEVERFNIFIEKFLSDLDFGYSEQKYSITLNLEGTMTQKVSLPKVKKKELPVVLRSILVSEGVAIDKNTELSYSVIKDNDSKLNSVYSYILSQNVSDGITKAFNELNLKVKYIDVSPNTIIKVFNKSDFHNKEQYPLQLVVDLEADEVKYYQFENKGLRLNYLESSKFENKDNYLQYFEDNVQQFKDEYGDYTLEDMEIILMGDKEIIEEVIDGLAYKLTISKFSEGLSFLDNYSFNSLDLHINTIGSVLRNDKILSSDSKYDINLLDKRKVNLEADYSGLTKALGISLLGLAIMTTIYLGSIQLESNRLVKDNTIIEQYVNDKEIKDQYSQSMIVNDKMRVYDRSLDTMILVEEHFTSAKKPYSSSAIQALYDNLPKNSEIEGGLTLAEGKVKFKIKTHSEADFLNYASKLTSEDKLFSKIKYSSYSGSKTEGYVGEITVTMGGEDNE